MNDWILPIALAFGALLMCIPISVQMKWYGVHIWKSVIISVAIIITGLIGARIWFFLENGYWEGRSFYGAIFFAPFTFLIVAKVIRVPYLYALDFCATAGCLILAVLKVQCILEGCCAGIVLFIDENHMYVRFPSQLIEFVCALILVAVLLWLSHNVNNRGRIYPITLVMYGAVRFVLNFFRDDWNRTQQMGLIMPLGNIWSLISIVLGSVWLITQRQKSVPNLDS